MYSICKTKNMDRFFNNNLNYPVNGQPTLRRNKPQGQYYSNGASPAANQHAPFPWHRQTPGPEQPPLDWNIPVLPERSRSYSAAQSFVQDLNTALPPSTTRAYQTGARTVPGTESFYCGRSISGGFLSLNHSLLDKVTTHKCVQFYTFRALINPLPITNNGLVALNYFFSCIFISLD